MVLNGSRHGIMAIRVNLPMVRDPYDGIELTGNGKLQINGEEGIATASGSAPRIRVVDLDFNNTEITFYGKRVSESEEISYQGFVA